MHGMQKYLDVSVVRQKKPKHRCLNVLMLVSFFSRGICVGSDVDDIRQWTSGPNSFIIRRSKLGNLQFRGAVSYFVHQAEVSQGV